MAKKEQSDTDFLLGLAKSLDSIYLEDLTSTEHKIFKRFEDLGVLKLNKFDEVEVVK